VGGRHEEVSYYVYIATNRTRTFYTGMTDDLRRRQHEHATGQSAFTAKYHIDHIIYFETFDDAMKAAAREQQLKRYTRRKKIALIESLNPNWSEGGVPWLP